MKIKLRGGVSLTEQISFYRQLAVILRSGLPLLHALQLLQKHGSAKQMLLCYRLQQRLRRGSSLAQALAAGTCLLQSSGGYVGGCGRGER